MQSASIPHMTGLLRALRGVQGGRITADEPDGFFDGGRPVPGVLVPFLQELFAHGQIQLEEQRGSRPARVVMSTAGEELLAELENQTERLTSDEP